MAKKQFIRHLEFYGFPDQNTYESNIGDLDLSDIREKNKEQDEEIGDLETEKANKKDLDELSGTVESLISIQSEINQGFANAISGITDDINYLKEVDTEFGEQLSAITSAVTELADEVDELGENVSGISEDLTALSGEVLDFSADTIDALETLAANIDEKLDKDEAEELFAKKDDVYTKDEIDEMVASGFSGYVTVEWVESQGYLTEEEADAKYATLDDVTELAEVTSALSDSIDSISGNLETFEEETNNKIENIEDAIENLVDSFDEDIAKLSGDVADLHDLVDTKADQEDFSNLVDVVNGISQELETKASVRELDEVRTELQGNIDALDEAKADKTGLEAVSGAVDSLDEKLDAEIARAISAETALGDRINELGVIVESAATKVDSYEERVHNLETGLTQEIADREQADLDLIGLSDDPKTADTIWGAKNFAKSMKSEAVAEANVYTDEQVSTFEGELDNLRNWAEQNFSSGATKEWVNERLQETEEEIEAELGTKIQSEIDRAEAEEQNIWIAINQNRYNIITNTDEIAHNATRIGSITEWDGSLETVDQYDDSGNGVLDVLHREFHEYIEKDGIIESIDYDGENLIIKYKTTEGEKTTIIPVGTLVDLTDYYKKEEVDSKLDKKADLSALTEVIDNLDDNTEAINTLNSTVISLNNKIDIEIARASGEESRLENIINSEIERATSTEQSINDRIDNLILECGIY